jgi:tetratricopeptide (TPR) repeat protein
MLPNEEQAAIHRDRAYRLFEECRVKDALLELKESLKHDTRDAASLRLLGQIFGEAGYHEPAISYAQRAVAEDYSNLESWLTLITLFARLGGPYLDLALEQAEAAKSVLGDHAHLFYLEGNVYGQKGDKKIAVECLQKALEMQPDHPQALNDMKALGA